MQKIWKKDYHTDWTTLKIGDWVEGIGQITTKWEEKFIHNLGQQLNQITQKTEPGTPSNGDIDKGVWYRSSVSGLWYTEPNAAGDISFVRVNGQDYFRYNHYKEDEENS